MSKSSPDARRRRERRRVDVCEYRMFQDAWFLDHCDRCIVLMLDGWQESKGVKVEIETFTQLGKPVDFLEYK